MVSHVVLFRLRPDLAPHDREGLVAALRTAVGGIPSIRRVRIGRRVTFGAGYEQGSPDFDLGAVIEFDDLAALQAYLAHPAHEELGRRFNAAVERALVWDYEMSGLEGVGVLETVFAGI